MALYGYTPVQRNATNALTTMMDQGFRSGAAAWSGGTAQGLAAAQTYQAAQMQPYEQQAMAARTQSQQLQNQLMQDTYAAQVSQMNTQAQMAQTAYQSQKAADQYQSAIGWANQLGGADAATNRSAAGLTPVEQGMTPNATPGVTEGSNFSLTTGGAAQPALPTGGGGPPSAGLFPQ